MNRAEKGEKISEILSELYPEPPIPLDHHDAFSLLVAVLLSAQTTDQRVNLVTPDLWALGTTPSEIAELEADEILDAIKTCGLAPTKAKNVKRLSELLVEEHDGEVPDTFEALEALPGVGHKTASVVMAQWFDVPAFPVDTHIHRLGTRWGLTTGKNVEQTEKDLKKVFAKETWNDRHLQIIYFGREHCPARSHDFDSCPICSWAASKAVIEREIAQKAAKKKKKKSPR